MWISSVVVYKLILGIKADTMAIRYRIWSRAYARFNGEPSSVCGTFRQYDFLDNHVLSFARCLLAL